MSNQVIVFELGEQTYGIDIEEVSEISHVLPITELPSQNRIEGIVDVRGSIHSVISLRKALGMPLKEPDENSKFIILREGKLALLADEVSNMATIEEAKKKSMKNITMLSDNEFLSYVAKWNNTLITIIDIKSLLKNQVVSAS